MSSAAPDAASSMAESDTAGDKQEGTKEGAESGGSSKRIQMFASLSLCTLLAVGVIGFAVMKHEGKPEAGDNAEEEYPLQTLETPETPKTTEPPQTPEPQHSCEWSYEGDSPAKWGDLKCFPIENKCGDGKMQSPIKFWGLDTEYTDDDFEIKNYYNPSKFILSKNQFLRMTAVDHSKSGFLHYKKMDGVALADGNFTLRELHFHAGTDEEKGSEHALPPGRCALEVHFVNVKVGKHNLTEALSEAGNVVVLAVLYKVPKTSIPKEARKDTTLVDQAFETIAASGGSMTELFTQSLIGENDYGFYIYKGSLTYPPCSEGVRWLVLAEPVSMKRETMKRIRDMLPKPSSRIFRDAKDDHEVKLKTADVNE